MGGKGYCIKVLLAMSLDNVIPGALIIACNSSSFHPGLLRRSLSLCLSVCVCVQVSACVLVCLCVHACLCVSVQVPLCVHTGVCVDQRATFL